MLEVFRHLSGIVGKKAIGWRYDPIFTDERYTAAYHICAFSQMAEALRGYTDTVVISFIDLYRKVQRNFPQVREVTREERLTLGRQLIGIAKENGMRLVTCAEGKELETRGGLLRVYADIRLWKGQSGKAFRAAFKPAREGCSCYLAHEYRLL